MDERGIANRGTEARGTSAGFRATGSLSFRGTGPATTDPQKFTIYFEKAQHELETREQLRTIENVASLLQQHAFSTAHVVGHASTEGDPAYNEQLSARRAESVAKYLKDQGIRIERVVAEGVGERHPAVPEDGDETKRASNRRVEITIEPKNPAEISWKLQAFTEEQIRNMQEAIGFFENKRRELERALQELLDRAKHVPGLAGPGDFYVDIDDLTERIEMYRRHLDLLEAAILEGAPPDRFLELDRERQNWYRNIIALSDQRLRVLRARLAEAQAEKSNATNVDQQRFWTEAENTFQFQIQIVEDQRATFQKEQERERAFEAKR